MNELEVMQKTEEPLERVNWAFMECDTLQAITYGRPHVPSAASHTQNRTSNSALVIANFAFPFLRQGNFLINVYLQMMKKEYKRKEGCCFF